MTMADTGASESLNPVLAGEDGYLFLVKGAHSVLDLCQGTHRATEASVRAFGDNLRTITLRYRHSINKHSAASNFLTKVNPYKDLLTRNAHVYRSEEHTSELQSR